MTDRRGDSRWRAFRVGALGFHLVFSVGFSVLVTYSVFKSVLEMSPGPARPGPQIFTHSQCVKGAKAMLDELEGQRRAYTSGSAAQADHRFLEFRIDWLGRKRRLESGCGLEKEDRGDLKELFGELDGLVNLYTTESVQFAGSIGGEIDRAKRLIDRLETTESAGGQHD